MNPMLLKKHNH